MSESFSPEDIEGIILFNEKIVGERGEGFEVDREILKRLFSRVANFHLITNRKTRIVTMASNIMARITFDQPFFEGNKETALSVTTLFLRRNGFELPLDTRERKMEVYNILQKTAFKFPGDRTIVSEMNQFLSDRVIDLVT